MKKERPALPVAARPTACTNFALFNVLCCGHPTACLPTTGGATLRQHLCQQHSHLQSPNPTTETNVALQHINPNGMTARLCSSPRPAQHHVPRCVHSTCQPLVARACTMQLHWQDLETCALPTTTTQPVNLLQFATEHKRAFHQLGCSRTCA